MHDEDTVDLLAYVKRLGRFLLPAAIVGLVAAAVVAALALTAKQTYHMKAHVLVTSPASTGETGVDPEAMPRLMRTYVALEDLSPVVEAAAANTKGRFTAAQVEEQTELYWGGGSMLLAVRAFASSEADAKLLADAMAAALVAKGPGLLPGAANEQPRMTLIEKAKQDDDPTVPQPQSLPMKLVPAVGAGLVVTVVAAMALELVDSRRRRRVVEA